VTTGDSYAGSRGGGAWGSDGLHGGQTNAARDAKRSMKTASRRRDDEPIPRSDVRTLGLKPKDLVGQPWRLAFALQADGWWLRQDVIWHKKNPMPESTKDRCTKAHEYLFLLAKSERYYFDQDAIKELASEDTHARYARGRAATHKHSGTEGLPPGQKQHTIAKSFAHMRKPVAGWAVGQGDDSAIGHAQEQDGRSGRKLLTEGAAAGDGKGERMGHTPGWRARKLAAADSDTKNNGSFDAAMAVMPELRNKRSVWSVATEPFSEAHFATFPPALISPCIEASCPPGGTVLDPFGGAATTGLVADRLGRNALLCELNRAYIGMGERRIAADAGSVARQIPLRAAA